MQRARSQGRQRWLQRGKEPEQARLGAARSGRSARCSAAGWRSAAARFWRRCRPPAASRPGRAGRTGPSAQACPAPRISTHTHWLQHSSRLEGHTPVCAGVPAPSNHSRMHAGFSMASPPQLLRLHPRLRRRARPTDNSQAGCLQQSFLTAAAQLPSYSPLPHLQ